MKITLDESSSASFEEMPLVVGLREAAVFAIVRFTPALVSSLVVSGRTAVGDIERVCRRCMEGKIYLISGRDIEVN